MAKILCRYFNKPCLEHQCTHYVQIHGSDPQTGAPVAEFMCADIAMLKVALEGNKEVRQHAAATESFRNEMVMANVKLFDRMDEEAQPMLPAANVKPALEHNRDA